MERDGHVNRAGASASTDNDLPAPWTSVLGFRVRPGRETSFIEAFEACGMLERPKAIPGFGSARLLQQMDDASSFIVIGTWHDPADYAEWTAKSRDGADVQALQALADCILEVLPGRLYGRVL